MKLSALSILPLLGLSSLLLASAGCGPGAVGAAVRPEDPTATSALGDDKATCHDVESGGEPLVVDWKPEQRGDLEEAMHDGVAVVAYSCEGIKLLKQCHIEGQYGFLGMTKREQVVKLSNSDELRANLPSIGGPMALKLSGEMQRGATLDIAMIMIGKKRTTWEDPTTADLKGKCEGATHYVRGALVGAFVMKTGTKGQVAVAGQMFGVDAGAASSSEKDVRNQDGDPADCANASPDSEKAPPQCGAAVRLTLSPIVKGDAQPAADAQAKAAPEDEASCPKGLVMSEGKCTNPAEATAYLCKMGDLAECTAQCDKGHAGSCGNLGRMYMSGNGADQDWKKAGEALQKGCDGGEAKACVSLGQLTFNGRGRKEDPAAAVALYDKACAAGDADGCGLLGQAYLSGKGATADAAKAASYFEKSCDGGNDAGCYDLGKLYAAGTGVTQDNAKAAELYKRACDGSQAEACDLLGVMHETGAGVRNDKIYAGMLYRRGCDRNSPQACVDLGRIFMGGGPGGSADDAKRLFERGCMQQVAMGCAVLKLAFGGTQPVFPDVAKAQALQQSCVRGNARDCASDGVLSLAAGNTQGSFNLQMACQRGDQFACAIQKAVKKP